MTQTYEQVDPTIVRIGDNVRLDAKMDKDFVASIRERGVLEPVLLYRGADGTLTVLAGQRRTLAAQQCGQPTIPALISDAPPAEIDRLVDQYVENEHRTALSNSERIAAIAQMTLAGLSEHQIARRTATPKATVQAAKTAAQAPTLLEYADQLTLDQAAVLTEFEDDPEAIEALLDAAQGSRFEHVAQRLRDDRADTAKRAEFAAGLAGQGLTVVAEPGYGDSNPVRRLSRLTDADGNDLTPEKHAGCPGHAVYVTTAWRSPDQVTDADQAVTDANDDDDEYEEVDEGEESDRRSWQPPVEVLVPCYLCTDAAAHGHLDRWTASRSGSEPERKRAADMTNGEREAAMADRRNVIESNKAWKAATTVRRDWLTGTFAHRRTAPAGAEAYLARVVTEGWGHERATTDALTLAGFPAREDVDPWVGAAEQRTAVAAALAAATPKRALQIGLAVAVAMWETWTHSDTWRAADTQTVLTLTRLQEWGYPVSDIEQRILTEAADRTTQD